MLDRELTFGVGTWAWGDRLVWDYGQDYGEKDLREAFLRFLNDGVVFFSTSPSFAEGEAEKLLGKFAAETRVPLFISTKYVPRFWHLRRKDFMKSLKASMLRLNVNRLKLLQICPPAGRMTLNRLAECAAEAMDLGLVDRVGLSGYDARQIDTFNEALSRFGYAVDCLETPYNLLHRDIETNGILELCRELKISVIAQQPLAMGLLTGKYDGDAPAAGSRRQFMLRYSSPRLDLLLRTMNHIGLENDGKNCAQVALNWICRKGIIPIPGVKSLDQAIENAQTPRWQMTDDQVRMLDNITEIRNPGTDGESESANQY